MEPAEINRICRSLIQEDKNISLISDPAQWRHGFSSISNVCFSILSHPVIGTSYESKPALLQGAVPVSQEPEEVRTPTPGGQAGPKKEKKPEGAIPSSFILTSYESRGMNEG